MILLRGIRKSEQFYYAAAMTIVFFDIVGGGNLNLLYCVGIVFTLLSISSRKNLKTILILYIPFVFMTFCELLLSSNSFDILRVIVYMSKIFINISLLSVIKRKSKGIDLFNLINKIYKIFLLLLVLSILTYGKEFLWRIGDEFNSFSKNRLEFFYSEPSVLGEVSSINIILCFYYYIYINNNKEIKKMLFCFSAVLALTFSVSAIVYTFVSVVAILVFNNRKIKKRNIEYIICILLGIIIVLTTSNPISNRIYAMIKGEDGSFNYRWTATLNTLPIILQKTNYWGLGLGNLNTQSGIEMVSTIGGMDYKFANSFPYFLAENGILGGVYIVLILGYLLIVVLKKGLHRNIDFPLRLSLLIYVFISQFAGGYFTNPFIWCVYGLISCDSNIFEYKEKTYDKRTYKKHDFLPDYEEV